MTRLDQAFIKVYADRGGALSKSLDSPGPGSRVDPPGERPREQTGEDPVGVSIDNVLEVLQATAARFGDLLPPEKTSHAPPDTADRAATYRVDAGTTAGSAAPQAGGPPVRPPHVRWPRADVREENHHAAGAVVRRDGAVGHGSGDSTFQPMLQVDRFIWPPICRRLDEAAAGELDRLADGLTDVMAGGNKVVAIGGCRRGEGATTLLLCGARRLAGRGLKVLMVDANLADPQLACRLGLLPQAGWEDVLAGRLPLEEVVIESAGDRLAVLPVCRTFAGAGETAAEETRLAESIQTLAAHFDLVLLDPGPLEELGAVGASLARGIGSRLDAIALVHHGGLTPLEDLDEVRRWLAASKIVQVGVIENFVRD